jgi:plastocyanin
MRLLAAAAALAALGCSGDDAPSEAGDSGGDFTVGVVNNAFDPATLTVPVASTVVWQWNSAGVEHNVTFQDGATSGNKNSGSFPRTFPTAGVYSYQCTIHGAQGMTGTVTVSAPGTGGGGGGGGGSGGGGGDYP